MIRKVQTLLAALAVMAGPAFADTVDPAAISELAESCQICHGPMGQGSGEIKAIGGRPAAELVPLMTGFRDGTIPSTLMSRLMKPLTDDEIAALAAEIATWK